MVASPIRPFQMASRKGACENIFFSISLFAAGDVSRETSPAVKGEEKRMFSQAKNLPTERRIQTNQWSVSFAVLLSPGRYERKPEFTGHSSQAALCDSTWEIEQHPPMLDSSLGVFVGCSFQLDLRCSSYVFQTGPWFILHLHSLRGRRLKGKGKGVLGAREMREARPSRPKSPFPSLSNACHAGYSASSFL